jgi:hypothetical protein
VGSLGLDYRLGIDGLSMPLVVINGALTLMAAWASHAVSQRPRLYFALLLVISGAVNGAFLAENLLLFFLFYELELIPLWLLIAIWGGENRAYAATKFLLFTAVSGMLILGAFFGLALVTGRVDFSSHSSAQRPAGNGDPAGASGGAADGIRHQDSPGSLSHLAAGRPYRGLHSGLGAAGWGAAQTGHLWPAAIRPRPVPPGMGPAGPLAGGLGGGVGVVWLPGGHSPSGI